ncbi:MAG TPA: flagellar export chaperone FliS [Terriglobales bacterium]|nr:flagellar export chaperone FliS [Terriglobales bacterium]
MHPPGNELTYRQRAVEGESSVGLVVLLYDRLIADLQRGAVAMRRQDVETRCAQLKHALLILQQLEGSLDREAGGEAAGNLAAFYAHARGQVMEAQLNAAPELLEKLTRHIFDVRAAWQQVDPAKPQSPQPPKPSVKERLSFSA